MARDSSCGERLPLKPRALVPRRPYHRRRAIVSRDYLSHRPLGRNLLKSIGGPLGWYRFHVRSGRLDGQHPKMRVLILRDRRARRLHADAGRWRMNDDLRIDLRIFRACRVYCFGNPHHPWRCERCGVPSRRKLAEIADGWRNGPQGSLPRIVGDCRSRSTGLAERCGSGTKEKT